MASQLSFLGGRRGAKARCGNSSVNGVQLANLTLFSGSQTCGERSSQSRRICRYAQHLRVAMQGEREPQHAGLQAAETLSP